MFNGKIEFLILLLFSLTLAACSTPPVSTSSPSQEINIVSLKDNYHAMQEMALTWDDNAYLNEVQIPVYLLGEENQMWLLSAHFQSPDKFTESITVELYPNGNITVEHIPHEVAVVQSAPILLDQIIDSSEVLIYFEKDEMIKELRPGVLSILYLERVATVSNNPVVWRLTIGISNSQSLYIDAFSGENLEIRR